MTVFIAILTRELTSALSLNTFSSEIMVERNWKDDALKYRLSQKYATFIYTLPEFIVLRVYLHVCVCKVYQTSYCCFGVNKFVQMPQPLVKVMQESLCSPKAHPNTNLWEFYKQKNNRHRKK